MKKSTEQWSFKLGFQALLDGYIGSKPVFHIYPDMNFGFNIVPSYVSFFAGLSGKLEKNDPLKVLFRKSIFDNPEVIFVHTN